MGRGGDNVIAENSFLINSKSNINNNIILIYPSLTVLSYRYIRESYTADCIKAAINR